MFHRLAEEWNVPFDIINDGDVTALAGGMALDLHSLLGIALGSSQAVGYLNPKGAITGWLNELCFVPVDFNQNAVKDEWSGDTGCGASYFSQQAVARLVQQAGIELPSEMPMPEILQKVQELMRQNDPRAKSIYETIGIYMGYAIPLYALFYDIQHILLLGRVTTGIGGEIIKEAAENILKTTFPDLTGKVIIHLPDEKTKRHGQAVAAASLPAPARK